jgi:hypothetical protein
MEGVEVSGDKKNKSCSCGGRLISLKEDYGVYGYFTTKVLYCDKCGLMYHKVNK